MANKHSLPYFPWFHQDLYWAYLKCTLSFFFFFFYLQSIDDRYTDDNTLQINFEPQTKTMTFLLLQFRTSSLEEIQTALKQIYPKKK